MTYTPEQVAKPAKNSIYTTCKRVLKITDEELEELIDIAKSQLAYCHPLKNGTAVRMHKLGQHNMDAVKKLRELRDLLKGGAKI